MKQSDNPINKIDAASLKRLPDRALATIRSSLSSLREAVNGSKDAPKSKTTCAQQQGRFASQKESPPARKIWHYQLYLTDGYINPSRGAWPPGGDSTSIPGWNDPIYIWGFTDLDPNVPGNIMFVPKGAAVPEWSPVGNAKFPGPFLECAAGDDLFITVYNRGFFQKNQKIQDDISLHLHGVNSPVQYDGFPESAGCYEETLRYFWEEDWYRAKGVISRLKDNWWNALTAQMQQALLKENVALIKPNHLNQAGGIYSLRNDAPYPDGIGGKIPHVCAEDWTRFTYHFRSLRPGATSTTLGPADPETRYNTLVAMKTNQKFLIRYINMGYQEHPMHQHEWHATIVGKDAVLQNPFKDVFTILVGSGETYDTITLANPVWGVTDPAGSPLSTPHPLVLDANGKPTLKWRQIFPIHDHDDYRVTTNDLYPGGGAILQVVTDVPNTPANTPTWFNPFSAGGAGAMDVIPALPAAPIKPLP